MSALNGLTNDSAPGRLAGAVENGDSQQQRMLRDLERAWLRSWQQASPGEASAHQPGLAGTAARSQALPGQAALARHSGDVTPISADDRLPVDRASSTTSQGLRCAMPAGASDASQDLVLPPGAVGSETAGVAGQPATAAESDAGPVDQLGGQRSRAPLSTSPPSRTMASLHLRTPEQSGVMVALRDARLDAEASLQAASALAQRMAMAGYARVQIYVNGGALRRDIRDASPPRPLHPASTPEPRE